MVSQRARGKARPAAKERVKRFRAQVMVAASDILMGRLQPITIEERRKGNRVNMVSLVLEHDSSLASLERAIFVGEPEADTLDGESVNGRCPYCGGLIRVTIGRIEAVSESEPLG